MLLLCAPFISYNEMYVLCLEGNGQITVEKQHYNGTKPFMNNSRQASSVPLPLNNKCNNTNHIGLAFILLVDDACYDFDFDPPQLLQDAVQPPTEYVLNKHVSFVPFLNHPSTANLQIKTLRSTVLLV